MDDHALFLCLDDLTLLGEHAVLGVEVAAFQTDHVDLRCAEPFGCSRRVHGNAPAADNYHLSAEGSPFLRD